MRLDVRRLAAVDMYGGAGSRLRRRIILVEFVLGAVLCCALGGWLFALAADTGWRGFGLAFVGIGLNYLPLAVHAVHLSPAGRLEAELDGVDIGKELRYYSVAQVWILVPLMLAVMGAAQAIARRRRQS